MGTTVALFTMWNVVFVATRNGLIQIFIAAEPQTLFSSALGMPIVPDHRHALTIRSQTLVFVHNKHSRTVKVIRCTERERESHECLALLIGIRSIRNKGTNYRHPMF